MPDQQCGPDLGHLDVPHAPGQHTTVARNERCASRPTTAPPIASPRHRGPTPAVESCGPGEAPGGLRPAFARVALPPVLHRDAPASREAPAPSARHRRVEPLRDRRGDGDRGSHGRRGGRRRALHSSQRRARRRRGGGHSRRPYAATAAWVSRGRRTRTPTSSACGRECIPYRHPSESPIASRLLRSSVMAAEGGLPL